MKSIPSQILLSFFLSSVCVFYGQETLTPAQIKSTKMEKELPSFSISGDNYFVTGTTLWQTPDADNSDAKFQLGFKQIITRDLLPFDTNLFLAYQQLAFWDIYKDSFPFKDINYNPSLGFGKLLFDEDINLTGGAWFAFEHQSNGLDGEDSRSWNYFSLEYYHIFSEKFHTSIKGWVPIGSMDGNPDLLEYRGYGKVSLLWRPAEILFVEGEFEKALRTDWHGNAQISVSLRYSKTTDQYIYLQYYVGQGESLLDYTQNTNSIRLGIKFKDMMFWD